MRTNHEQHSDDNESMLDAGLRAAFGAPTLRGEAPSAASISVLDELEARLGVRSRILLRDEGEYESAITFMHGQATRAGRYQMLGEIARGGMGVVLKGRDVDLGRDVAVKVLQEQHLANASMVRRFVEEAQIAGQLQHPGVLPVYELGMQGDRRPYFAMKLVKGRTLASLLENRHGAASDRARLIRIFESVCQTIAYAHSRGVIHRDLKPSNILVGAFGEVQVVDWGLAKVLTQAAAPSKDTDIAPDQTFVQTLRSETPGSQSLDGSVMGTPAYMAPEQARGDLAAIDERADVFALGGMLCEILTGKPPFEGTSREMMADAAAARLDRAIVRLNACDADEDLIALAKACMSMDPRQRPRTGKQVAEAVAAHLASVEDRARSAELEATVAKAREAIQRRAKRITIALASIALLALVAIGAGWAYVKQDHAQRVSAASQRVNDALDAAAVLLGQAQKAPIGETASWAAARAAGDRLQATADSDKAIDQPARERARAFLARLSSAQRDRSLVESVEDAIIIGATHLDRQSWMRMAEQLRTALLEFGIDVRNPPANDVADRIRASESSIQLVEAIEMWIGSEGQLGYFGVQNFPVEHLNHWVKVLHEADTNAFRTGQRAVYYAILNEYVAQGRPDPAKRPEHVAALDRLMDGVDMKDQTPRSLSWLATTYFLVGESQRADELYRAAVIAHPTDFMLTFDFVYTLERQGKWEEALRYLMACVAIRPTVGGVWRKLGVAFREINLLQGSLDALQQSLRLQPDHAPTLNDLAMTLHRLNRADEAMAAVDQALRFDGQLPSAHGTRGRLLQEAGDHRAALDAYRRALEFRSNDPEWKAPVEQWIQECEAALDLPATTTLPGGAANAASAQDCIILTQKGPTS